MKPSDSEQSLEYIRRAYQVPAVKGKHVEIDGKRGVVTGGQNAYVLIQLEMEKKPKIYHPKHEGLDWREGEQSA